MSNSVIVRYSLGNEYFFLPTFVSALEAALEVSDGCDSITLFEQYFKVSKASNIVTSDDLMAQMNNVWADRVTDEQELTDRLPQDSFEALREAFRKTLEEFLGEIPAYSPLPPGSKKITMSIKRAKQLVKEHYQTESN